MFPNVRWLIVATFAAILLLSCGFGLLVAIRATHEPLKRLELASAPSRADNGDQPALAMTEPFQSRFPANSRPVVAVFEDLQAVRIERDEASAPTEPPASQAEAAAPIEAPAPQAQSSAPIEPPAPQTEVAALIQPPAPQTEVAAPIQPPAPQTEVAASIQPPTPQTEPAAVATPDTTDTRQVEPPAAEKPILPAAADAIDKAPSEAVVAAIESTAAAPIEPAAAEPIPIDAVAPLRFVPLPKAAPERGTAPEKATETPRPRVTAKPPRVAAKRVVPQRVAVRTRTARRLLPRPLAEPATANVLQQPAFQNSAFSSQPFPVQGQASARQPRLGGRSATTVPMGGPFVPPSGFDAR